MSSPKELTLEEIVIEFQEWRSHKKYKQAKIPVYLWDKAKALTSSHSPGRVAKKLGLNLNDLKKRLNPQKICDSKEDLSQTFIEASLSFTNTNPFPSCQSVEFERADGSKMKIQAPINQSFDLSSLMTAFLGESDVASHTTN